MSTPVRRTVPPWAVIPAAIAALVLVRLVMFRTYVGGDEAGFLMVSHHWHDGPSLYGSYWVDRPPLLLWLNELAGGVTSLRILGLAASVLTVLGAACAAQVARGAAAARWAAGAAALFGGAQWLGIARVNGEMLAAPFVAWSIALTLHAVLRPSWRVPAAFGAGVLAVCALSIKQSVIEAFVFALALGLAMVVQRRDTRPVVVRVLAWGVLGALLTLAAVLLGAEARGTSPSDLFDAVIRFRAEAGEVIRSSASDATPLRLLVMMGTWTVSGLGAATALTAWQGVRRKDPLLLATAATLLCSLVIALFGGSYWAHYLIQMVPAASLGIGLLAGQMPAHLMRRLAVATVTVTLANLVWAVGFEPDDNGQQHTIGTWLREARQPGDTGVVTFGQANVLYEADLSSPYIYLWSLPVRTRDPHLRELAAVIASPQRPTWVVNWSGLNSWGIEPGRTEAVLRDGYRKVATICGRSIWLLTTQTRTLPVVPKVCP
ncbi:hypothetical protein ASC61_14090 [Aeromicrobium sp. Root344]|uniref:hypothetical protein n=1 Tax=Aeromicrobium sp. Root344 TaxID=1736521 RepID=UPI0006F60F17|nr:hypothetical protein [Aeromicrobium sp. Root344]KQV76041.1 hypothetical protein ASC61_14090 [Aeromicrobium sp. Root344]